MNKNAILVSLTNDNKYIKLISYRSMSQVVLKEFTTDSNSNIEIDGKGRYVIILPLLSYNSYILTLINKKFNNLEFETDKIKNIILESAESTENPKAELINDKFIGLKVPSFPSYIKLLTVLGAKNQMLTLWTIPISKLYEIYRFLKVWNHPFLPNFEIGPKLEEVLSKPISNKLPSLENLFNIQFEELSTIQGGLNAYGRWKVDLSGFEKLKYKSGVDLLLSKPKSYQDRTNLTTFKYAPFGEKSYVKGTITYFSSFPNGSGKITIHDGTDEHTLFMYGIGWQTKIYQVGDIVVIELIRVGKDKFNGISIIPIEEIMALPILPNYRQRPSSNITNKLLINSTQELLLRYNGHKLFDYVKGAPKTFWKSIEHLHFPKDVNDFENTLESLAYYELLSLQLLFLENKNNSNKNIGISKYTSEPKMFNESIEKFQFKPTEGQTNAITEIIKCLNSEKSEKILLSGDVGTGKSFVANSVCFYTVDCGFQSVLIGPTEILAQQLYNGLLEQIKYMKNKPVIAYVSAKTKAKEKREIEKLVSEGHIDIIVGTHSVLNLEYNNLGLLVIDEQQKFGKAQRDKLSISRKDGRQIDILEQTATPIPQSTALAFYGDIKLVTLSEKPSGRKENITKWINQSAHDFLKEIFNPVWKHIFSEIEKGHQIFIVTPSVDEKSKSASVEKTMKIISNKFPSLKVDYVHGGMKKDKQNKTIEKFRENKIDVLIASSIVEVGIDIPNSTIMLVLDANRFGASSLHQIRGRVGRSDLQGYCYLVGLGNNSNSERRLQALVDSNNGFDIALVDLETRNTGNLFGLEQSGESNLKFCNLINHSNLIAKAQFEAKNLYDSDMKEQAILDAKSFLRITEEEDE